MIAKVAVLILDGTPDSTGEVFDPEGVKLPEQPVPVQLQFDTTLAGIVGSAKLTKEGTVVYADLNLLDHKLPPHAPRFLTPAVGGHEIKRSGYRIKEATIDRIGLCVGLNSDRRITTLANQGVKDNVPANRHRDPSPGTDVSK